MWDHFYSFETEKAQSQKTTPRLKSSGLRLQPRPKFLVLTNDTYTETEKLKIVPLIKEV